MEAGARSKRIAANPPNAKTGGIKEASRLLAVLLRRRAVDEPTTGDKGPPPITRQLAAMLPDRAAALIAEAVKLSEKESGEDPVWIRDLGLSREIGRGRSRGREREREIGGLSL